MLRCSGLFCVAFTMCAFGQTPDSAERAAMISRMREAALSYNEQLRDFMCTQWTDRATDHGSGGKKWSRLETQELEVGYFDHKEHYRLLKVNGAKADPRRIKRGYFTPGGEFGTSLRRIFEPKAQAAFDWDHAETDGGRRVCVFRYWVAVATTTLVMMVNYRPIDMGHHGLVYSDCETGAVLRYQMETEPALANVGGKNVAVGAKLDVRYGLTAIGDQQFLLPTEAEEIAVFDKALTRAEIKYGQYRKYTADSSVTFDAAKPE